MLPVSYNKSEYVQEYLWYTLIIQTSTFFFKMKFHQYEELENMLNSLDLRITIPSDKESLYLIPFFTHPPFQEIKP